MGNPTWVPPEQPYPSSFRKHTAASAQPSVWWRLRVQLVAGVLGPCQWPRTPLEATHRAPFEGSATRAQHATRRVTGRAMSTASQLRVLGEARTACP